MFSNLLESRATKARRQGGAVWSFLAHYGLILAAMYTSAQAGTVDERPVAEKVAYVEPVKQPEVAKPLPPDLVVAPRPVPTRTLLLAPVEIPNTLPEIDLRARVTDPNDYLRRSTSGTDSASRTAVAAADPSRDYLIHQVEKPVMQAPNSAAPVYPDLLRQAGVEGEALVTFVVDTSGRADLASFKVIRTTHDLFATAVRNALPKMRFFPAEVGERKVRQVVQQPFSFAIAK